jgi:hypothetical protein
MRSRSSQSPASSANAEAFRQLFVERVHLLLQIGYSRMNPADFSTTMEPDISGEIRRYIREFLDTGPLEPWMKHFTPLNEDPVDEEPRVFKKNRRTGEDRRLLDLHLECSERCPRTRFAFEAKRLHRSGAAAVYLSNEGLGRFVAGHYARSDFAAGMLGFVQTGRPDEWATEIEIKLKLGLRTYCVSGGRYWERVSMKKGPEHTYRSDHNRAALGIPIAIYHTLLLFH